MAKRFSKVSIGEDDELFFKGYIDIMDLEKSESFLNILEEKNMESTEKTPICIEHCLFLDFPDSEEDMIESELDDLIDMYDYIESEGYIYSEEKKEFEISHIDIEESQAELYEEDFYDV